MREKWQPVVESVGADLRHVDYTLERDGIEHLQSDSEAEEVTVKLAHGDSAKFLSRSVENMRVSPFEQLETFARNAIGAFMSKTVQIDDQIAEILKIEKPCAIVIDGFTPFPSIINSGIPYAYLNSANPLCFYRDERLPPPLSGLSVHADPSEWPKHRELIYDILESTNSDYAKWFAERIPDYAMDPRRLQRSPYLNMYIYPSCLDYDMHVKDIDQPPNSFRIDAAVRISKKLKGMMESPDAHSKDPTARRNLLSAALEKPIPDDFNCENPIIYVSMGSFACGAKDLMNHLLACCANMPEYSFVFSLGPLIQMKDTVPNIIGVPFTDQHALLFAVDGVVSHAGNNTFTETMYFGKPMVLMPVLADQHDNAVRFRDLGIGATLDTFNFTFEELKSALVRILDEEQRTRFEEIGVETQAKAIETLTMAVDHLESLGRGEARKVVPQCSVSWYRRMMLVLRRVNMCS